MAVPRNLNKWMVRLDESLIPIFQQIGLEEDRTFTDVARLLVREALLARGIEPPHLLLRQRQITNNNTEA
jgi:hypothetical protein